VENATPAPDRDRTPLALTGGSVRAPNRRWLVGLAFWLSAAALSVWWSAERTGASQRQVLGTLWQYATAPVTSVQFRSDKPAYLAVGDPIFVLRGDRVQQVGQVAQVVGTPSRRSFRPRLATAGTATLFAGAPTLGPGSEMRYFSSDDSLQWVLQTLAPPPKRGAILREITGAIQQNREEIVLAFRPVLEASLAEAMQILDNDIRTDLAAREEQWSRLGAKYQQEIVEAHLVPLVKREVWPMVLKHVEPVASDVGREIWERASLWRFGWRSAYDRLLPSDQPLARQEWTRFLRREVFPVLERRSEQFVQLQQKILDDVSQKPQVRAAFRQGLDQIIQDPELHELLGQTLKRVLVDNSKLHDALIKQWTGPEAQRALQITSEKLEPAVLRAAELVFGGIDNGITPELTRVLRNKVLRKDRRWLMLDALPSPVGSRGANQKPPNRLVLPVRHGGAQPAISPFAFDLKTHAGQR
jgi:hypothetical protein